MHRFPDGQTEANRDLTHNRYSQDDLDEFQDVLVRTQSAHGLDLAEVVDLLQTVEATGHKLDIRKLQIDF